MHRSRRTTLVGGHARRGGGGEPAPAANGGARSHSAVVGGGGGWWAMRGGVAWRLDTASCGASPAWVRLARFDARVEEEEGEAGRSRGSAPARATVALASPVGGEREEESGWGKENRVEAEAGGGNIFVWPDSDEEPEKPSRSRGQAGKGEEKHGKPLTMKSATINMRRPTRDRTTGTIRGDVDGALGGQNRLPSRIRFERSGPPNVRSDGQGISGRRGHPSGG